MSTVVMKVSNIVAINECHVLSILPILINSTNYEYTHLKKLKIYQRDVRLKNQNLL